jgi:hypothetical protein
MKLPWEKSNEQKKQEETRVDNVLRSVRYWTDRLHRELDDAEKQIKEQLNHDR